MTEKQRIEKEMKQYLKGARVLKETRFENADIVITDPCYIFPEEEKWGDKLDKEYDNFLCYVYEQYDRPLPKLKHLKNFIANSTLYGDWGCSVFEMGKAQPIGKFCADAGLVGVFDLREVHRMNPDFDWYKSRPWTTTLIRDFTGKVTIELKGKDSVRVVGRGNITFFSTQTSF